MRNSSTKISLFILIGILISACVSEKRVPKGKELLTKTEILVNGKKVSTEEVQNQLYQKPNSSLLGVPIRLNIYNMANLKHDSLYKAKFVNDPEKYKRQSKFLSAKQVNRLGESFWYAGINDFLAKTGEPPVIIDEKSSNKSALRLKSYYFNNGYFNVKTNFKIDSLAPKKGAVTYNITTGEAFLIDSLKTTISTPVLDSLYTTKKNESKIVVGKQYNKKDIDAERSRITTHFRNNGVYFFQQNYINFSVDTIYKKNKASIDLKISDYSYFEDDSTKTKPFKVYTISDVNIFTDYTSDLSNGNYNDSSKVSYNNFNLYSRGKLKYKPKAITNGVFITKGGLYADFKNTLTTRYLTNLKVFNYPTIKYDIDPRDSTQSSLIANVFLTPKKKYGLETSFDVTHSNVQDLGLGGTASLAIRNVFNGAETFQLSAQAIIGASADLSKPGDPFFNTNELYLDSKLNFPRILMFFNTDKIIPKSMIPSSTLAAGYGRQTNIGLDKESLTTSLSYNWTIKKNTSAHFELFSLQYVNNINTSNYFNVYGSSYNTLNSIAQSVDTPPSYFDSEGNLIIESGTNAFLNAVLSPEPTITVDETDYNTVYSINEQKNRLTENNLILSTSFSFSKSSATDIFDETFYGIKGKIETAGNLFSLITSGQPTNANGNNELFGLEFSQYIKTEFEYIKHWDLGRKQVLAFRSFNGIAIPYGNANFIPFSKSYYAGGSNDNRAWLAYSLGPGSSNTVDNYNEANLKIALNLEYRFNIVGKINGAFFLDAGNIWNIWDDVTVEDAVFEDFSSLEDIALGSGFGLRYDFNYFIFRLDFGFKTYNPANDDNKKWFYDYNFSNAVVNIGINYPF